MKLVSLFALILTAGLSAAQAQTKDTLNIAMNSEFETLNPLISTTAATKYMLYLAYRPVVVLDLDSNWKPMTLKAIPTLENKLAKIKGEGLEVNIEFLENFSWGDGTPVTCKDLEFTWTVGKNINVSNANRDPYENITSITWDAKTPKKCKITMAKKKFNYFYDLPDPLPSHIEGPIYEKFKDKAEGYDQNTAYTKDPANPGLYNGPFRISEVKLGSHVIFVQNEKWQGKKPFFKKVIFKLLPNNATHIANLKSGNVDMISTAAGIGLDQSVAFEKEIKEQNLPFTTHYAEGQVYAHIDFNLDHPILSDLKVRKALAMAVNTKEAIDSLMAGKAKPATQFVTDKDPWYNSKAAVYKYDPKAAAQLLDQAGWKMGPKGIRQKDGKDLSITISAGAGVKLVEMFETFMQDQYKRIGVQLLIKNEPGRVLFGETLPKRKFELGLYSWVSVPESSPRSTLHSSKIPSAANSWGGQNQPGWKNPEVDKLIDQLEGELNTKKRAEIGKKIVKLYTDELPVMPLYYRMTNSVTPKDMKGYRVSGHLFYETLYAENWSR